MLKKNLEMPGLYHCSKWIASLLSFIRTNKLKYSKLKGQFTQKLQLFTHPEVVPDLYEFHFPYKPVNNHQLISVTLKKVENEPTYLKIYLLYITVHNIFCTQVERGEQQKLY